MRFFSFQPEWLSTINVILGSKIGPVPTTVLFGAFFIVVLFVLFFVYKKKQSLSSLVLAAAAIAWLPLFAQFSYSSVIELKDTWFALFQPEAEQTIWRYCRIDKYQNLNGSFCSLYPFVEQLEKNIPAGSSISLFPSSSAPYLTYYLYSNYDMRSDREGSYVILFRPSQPYAYEQGKLYEDAAKTKLFGSYDIVGYFGPDQIIFKKK